MGKKHTSVYSGFYLFIYIIFTAGICTGRELDSVTVNVTDVYAHPHFITWMLSGSNYRQAWSTPVRMPVFDIKNAKGGLKIQKLGGGFQTKSLRMKDKNGTEWVLRTVDKDVKLLMHKRLQNTMANTVFQDIISSSFPYAPLTITKMGKAAGVVTAEPELFFVPEHNALGENSAVFANQVCYLERREPTPDLSDAVDTEDALEAIHQSRVSIAQKEVLRARLLDMLLADWDRHAGQWRWGKRDSSGYETYYPIPVDRDQAYFRSTGFLVKLMSISTLPHMNGFRRSTSDIKDLNYKSYSFDRFFINELDGNTWAAIINDFKTRMTDEVIRNAVKDLPPEIYKIYGEQLYNTLTSRRDNLVKDAIKYYKFTATDIYILSKDEPETFEISRSDDYALLSVYNTKTGKKSYERKLIPGETRNIHLFSIKDNDTLKMENSPIKVTRETLNPAQYL